MTSRIGCLSAVDFRRKSSAGTVEIFLSIELARTAIARAPDIDDRNMTSWGLVTRAELTRLIACEAHQESRQEYLNSIEQLCSLGDACRLTLYYSDSVCIEET